MLLRIRGPDGMQRLTVEKDNTFGDLGRQVRDSTRLAIYNALLT